jgi:hypothetical protein
MSLADFFRTRLFCAEHPAVWYLDGQDKALPVLKDVLSMPKFSWDIRPLPKGFQ